MNAQEALKEIVELFDRMDLPEDYTKFIELKDGFAKLQQLVDRATPKKPVGKHTSYKCPVCDRRVRSGKGSSSFGVDHYCQRCGQTLDWTNESEQIAKGETK